MRHLTADILWRATCVAAVMFALSALGFAWMGHRAWVILTTAEREGYLALAGMLAVGGLFVMLGVATWAMYFLHGIRVRCDRLAERTMHSL